MKIVSLDAVKNSLDYCYIFFMLDVTKLAKKTLKKFCNLIKINKTYFRHMSFHQKRLLLRALAIPIRYLLFDFDFIYERYHCFTYKQER